LDQLRFKFFNNPVGLCDFYVLVLDRVIQELYSQGSFFKNSSSLTPCPARHSVSRKHGGQQTMDGLRETPLSLGGVQDRGESIFVHCRET
jgi:hypothetical protein